MSTPQKLVDFYFDFGSPTAYLAFSQLPRICTETGAGLVVKPMLLGGVFKATGNNSPVSVPAKGRWMNQDIAQWAERYNVPFVFNPFFPINTLTLMRGAVGVQMKHPDQLIPYMSAVFNAIWMKGHDLGQDSEVAAVLAPLGFTLELFTAMVSDPAVKAGLIANTDEAVKRGVFGAPTFFVGSKMFFGQDRLDFVREALA